MIDEYASTPRRDVWFRPPIAPIMAPSEKISSRGVGEIDDIRFRRKRSGNSFCHVVRRRQIGQVKPVITLGNQKCRGAAPALIINPISRRVIGSCEIIGGEFAHTPPTRNVIDPSTWARKYLIAASYSLFEFV